MFSTILTWIPLCPTPFRVKSFQSHQSTTIRQPAVGHQPLHELGDTRQCYQLQTRSASVVQGQRLLTIKREHLQGKTMI